MRDTQRRECSRCVFGSRGQVEHWYAIRVDNEPSGAAQLKVNSTAGTDAGVTNTRRLQYF